MSNKNVDLTRLLPTLRHKGAFPYEYASREAMTVRWGAVIWPVVGRATH